MLTRWDPYREIMSVRRAMDRLMENVFSEESATAAEWGLALDVIENDNDFVVKASLPGLKPEDIDVTYNKGMLTIRGELKEERESEKGQYHLRERRYGTFARSISLPSTINADEIDATYRDGVLTLRLPKMEEAKPKRITVNNGSRKVIEARTK